MAYDVTPGPNADICNSITLPGENDAFATGSTKLAVADGGVGVVEPPSLSSIESVAEFGVEIAYELFVWIVAITVSVLSTVASSIGTIPILTSRSRDGMERVEGIVT